MIITFLLGILVVRQDLVLRTSVSARTRVTVTPPTILTMPEAEASISNRSKIIGGYNSNFEISNTRPKPKTHIAFLKVHKAASSTVQNILYRFGATHGLSFVLPQVGHYLSTNSDVYFPRIPPLDESGKYDILCNHVVFNETKFKSLMHDDAFYLAIVRNPLQRFVSAAYYYRHVFAKPYLSILNETTFIHDLITNPLKYEPPKLRSSRTFSQMAYEFNAPVNTVQKAMDLDESTMNTYVSQIMEYFHFVMIVKKFDESLVMLKRFLNWTMKDILYIKQNQLQDVTKGIKIQKVTAEDEAIYKETNRLDYLIYDKFVERFNEMAAKEKDLDAEVKEFRRTLQLVTAFCTLDTTRRETIFWETEFNAAFRVSRYDCILLMKKELEFNEELKKVQMLNFKNKENDDAESRILVE